MSPLRHQLASTSPLEWSGLARGAVATLLGRDARAELAETIAREYGSAGVLLCGSGTQALVLAFRAADLLSGSTGPVALPAFACFDVAAAAVRFARRVAFYDIDPETLGPDPESLRTVLEGGAGTALVALPYGLPPDWDRLQSVLDASPAVVVEDAAQGHGGRWRSERLGSEGRLAVLSFGRGKGWTGGCGGALLVRDPTDFTRIARLPRPQAARLGASAGTLARALAHHALGRPSIYGIPRSLPGLGLGETRYHDVSDPVDLPRVAAALLLASQGLAEAEAAVRALAASEYERALAGSSRYGIIRSPEGGKGGWIRFPVLTPGGIRGLPNPRAALALGAAPSYPLPLPQLPQIAPLGQGQGRLPWPGAERLAADLFTLPTHGMMSDEERRRLLVLLKP